MPGAMPGSVPGSVPVSGPRWCPERGGSIKHQRPPHGGSHNHVPSSGLHDCRERKPAFHSSGQDLYYPGLESGYHSSGGLESGFHSLGRESRHDRGCQGVRRSDSRGTLYHRDRDPSLTRVESRVGVLHADRRSGLYQGECRPSFLCDREARSTGLIHSSTLDHGLALGRPESRGMHHSSSAHETCSSRPESRCAHEAPRGLLCHEHARMDLRPGLVHSAYPERVQTALGLHHSASGHDSLGLSDQDVPLPGYHASDLGLPHSDSLQHSDYHTGDMDFPDRFRPHDMGFHPPHKLVDSSFRFPCPVHSPFRFRFANGSSSDYFGRQVSSLKVIQNKQRKVTSA